MQILEYTSIWEWCREQGIALEQAERTTRLPPDPTLVNRSRVVFAPNGPLGFEPAVAAGILDALGDWTECLLWVTTWGVWPSSEDWPRYYALRGRHGQLLSIDSAPGHLATRDDGAEFSDLLLQVLEQGWDAVLIPARDGRAMPLRINISHDGWVALHTVEPAELNVAGL